MFSPFDKRAYWAGIGALWLLLGAALWAAPSARPADCTPWGEPAPWGGSLRCGFSPTVSPVRDAIVRVRIQHPNRIRKASGFRVAEDLILTAAHTIRHPEAKARDGRPLDVTFFAQDGTPHRFPVRDVSVGPFDPGIYRSRGDWALLKIDPPERFAARFSLGAPCDGTLHLPSYSSRGEALEAVCKTVEIPAYPYNKKLAIWTSCDAANGMSGSPIVEDRGGEAVVVGVLSLELAGKPPWSFGPVITEDMRAEIERFSDYDFPGFEECSNPRP